MGRPRRLTVMDGRKGQAMQRLLRFNTVPHKQEQSTTWLELFFDLVYVAILIELGNRLSHDLSLLGVTEFVLLFIPIWLSWLEPVLICFSWAIAALVSLVTSKYTSFFMLYLFVNALPFPGVKQSPLMAGYCFVPRSDIRLCRWRSLAMTG